MWKEEEEEEDVSAINFENIFTGLFHQCYAITTTGNHNTMRTVSAKTPFSCNKESGKTPINDDGIEIWST